jgi:hypothetical protein
VNAFNNSTAATVHFDDGSGHSGTVSTLLTQLNVTYSDGAGTPLTFLTFSLDLFHTVSVGQTYAVNARDDLATAFTNGSRIDYIFQAFGVGDLTKNEANAVQIVIWDLTLGNHNPNSFGKDASGTYSSGDTNVFSVDLAGNPAADQISALVDQYLKASIGSTGQGGWLDAAAAGNDPNRGQSLMQPIPEPSSFVLCIIAAGCVSTWGLRRVGRQAHFVGSLFSWRR